MLGITSTISECLLISPQETTPTRPGHITLHRPSAVPSPLSICFCVSSVCRLSVSRSLHYPEISHCIHPLPCRVLDLSLHLDCLCLSLAPSLCPYLYFALLFIYVPFFRSCLEHSIATRSRRTSSTPTHAHNTLIHSCTLVDGRMGE